MTDESLLSTVLKWNATWGVISMAWLKRCQVNLDRYLVLDSDQRDGLRAIIKNNEIDPREYA